MGGMFGVEIDFSNLGDLSNDAMGLRRIIKITKERDWAKARISDKN